MPTVVFDTFTVISYVPEFDSNVLYSSVVLFELIAGAADGSSRRRWELLMRSAKLSNKLLTPTDEDWLEAGRALYGLRHGLKSKAHGRTPAIPANEVQRITRDMLIARTTRRASAILVTDNVKDFKLIARFCKVRVVSGKRFFAH